MILYHFLNIVNKSTTAIIFIQSNKATREILQRVKTQVMRCAKTTSWL